MIKIKLSINYCCKDCGNLICLRTAFYGKGRCKSCSNVQKIKEGVYDKHFKSLKGKGNPRYKNGKPKCINCGKKLTNYKSERCAICFSNSRKNKPRSGRKRFGKFAPSYKDGRSLKINYCLDCNKKISWKATKCYECWAFSNTGKKNGNYIHGKGYKKYPIVFNNRLKYKIRKRDNFICQKCGLREDEHYRGNKLINLTIHHIDYNKQNCKEDNLISLCHRCNVKANFNIDYWYAYYKYIMEHYIKNN